MTPGQFIVSFERIIEPGIAIGEDEEAGLLGIAAEAGGNASRLHREALLDVFRNRGLHRAVGRGAVYQELQVDRHGSKCPDAPSGGTPLLYEWRAEPGR
jgi:hypothetical protein